MVRSAINSVYDFMGNPTSTRGKWLETKQIRSDLDDFISFTFPSTLFKAFYKKADVFLLEIKGIPSGENET